MLSTPVAEQHCYDATGLLFDHHPGVVEVVEGSKSVVKTALLYQKTVKVDCNTISVWPRAIVLQVQPTLTCLLITITRLIAHQPTTRAHSEA